MKKLLALLLMLPMFAFAHWEDVTPLPFDVKGNNLYFNADVIEVAPQSYDIEGHTNPNCQYNTTSSGCRKGQVAYTRNKYDESKVRKHSFDFTLTQMWQPPEWLIIYQDWVRIHADDSNGNPPITTIKLRSFGGRLFLQHWDNSWQWHYDPTDYDQHLVEGMERMNGEYEIVKNQTYSIDIYTQDFAGIGRVYVEIDGVKISDAVYKASHPTEFHTVMTGMYWVKGFNSDHDPINNIKASYDNIRHEVLRF